MELWYTEEWTENVRFSIKVDKHLFSDNLRISKSRCI